MVCWVVKRGGFALRAIPQKNSHGKEKRKRDENLGGGIKQGYPQPFKNTFTNDYMI